MYHILIWIIIKYIITLEYLQRNGLHNRNKIDVALGLISSPVHKYWFLCLIFCGTFINILSGVVFAHNSTKQAR